MKNRFALLSLAGLLAATFGCTISLNAAPTLSRAQIDTLTAQTMIALQGQTLTAGGDAAGVLPASLGGPADSETDTMLPTVTPTGTMPSNASFTPTAALTPIPCNWAKLIADVTTPDNWATGALDHFTKTWRLMNIGSCPWTSSYALIFDHGEPMGAAASQQLTAGTVGPGGAIDVSVDLLSPAAAGSYQAYFKLRASDGTVFGIGPDTKGALEVKIRVVVGEPDLFTDQVENQASVAIISVGDVTANCPAGSIVVGGGFSGSERMTAHYQGLSGNGWRVIARNNSETAQILKAYAVCLTQMASVTVSQVVHEETLAGGASGYSLATCPSGSVISGLGYEFDPKRIVINRIDADGNTLQVYGKNISDSDQTLRAQAVCLTPAASATSVLATANTTVPGGTSRSVEAVCPPGTFLTGGGFSDNFELVITGLSKKPGADAWIATAYNPSGATLGLVAYAVCLTVAMM
jgi:hypothetical protein